MPRFFLLSVITGILGGIIARKKGRNPILWAILCFFLPLSVVIVAVLPAVPARGAWRRCPSCSGIVAKTDSVCRHCRKELPIELAPCSRCGSFVPSNSRCPRCGGPVQGQGETESPSQGR